MHRRTRALALLAAVALAATGCSAGAARSGPAVVTVQVTDDDTGEAYRALLGEYDAAHREVKIVVRELPSDEIRTNLFDRLGRSGLADLVAIETAWLPDLMRYSDLLAAVPKDEREENEGRWPAWAVRTMTDTAGRVVGYPASLAPRALCYRPDLFAAAGLPADPAGVGALATDWPTLLQTGSQYAATTGLGFLDSADSAFTVMMDQHAAPYELRATGEVVAAGNPVVRTAFDRVTADPAVFAGIDPGTAEWTAAAAQGAFAASLCAAGTVDPALATTDDPAAGTGTLAALVADGWEVADGFPGGGAASAASAFVVPAAGSHIERARDIADWLTAPEQQERLFAETGAFPSLDLTPEDDTSETPGPGPEDAEAEDADPAADEDADPAASPSPTEGDEDPFASPLAALLRARAEAITTQRFRGPATPEIERLMTRALAGARSGTLTPEAAWDGFTAAVATLP